MPVRPSVSALSWLALGTWLGVAGAEWVTWSASAGSRALGLGALSGWGGLALASLIAALAIGTRRRLNSAFVLAIIGIAAGTTAGIAYWSAWAGIGLPAQAFRSAVDVVSDASVGPFGASSTIARGAARYSAQWPEGSVVPDAGERVRIAGNLVALKSDEKGRKLHRSGIRGRVRVRVLESAGTSGTLRGVLLPVRQWARARTDRIPGDAGALLAGILTGDRRRLDETVVDADFRTCGLTHLVAVSGSHLVVVAACVAWIASSLHWRRSRSAAAVCAVCGAYVVFSGVQPSAVRAWLMAAVAFLGPLAGRRSDAISGLALAVCAMLLLSPPSAFDLGFQLSVLAVAGLVLLGRIFEVWVSCALPGLLRLLSAPSSMTLVACLVTLPVTATTFGMVSLVSPIANLVVGPMVEAAIALGLIAMTVSAILPRVGLLLLSLVASLLGAASSAAHSLAQIPGAAVPSAGATALVVMALAVGCVLLWALWPRPTPRLARAVAGVTGIALVMAVFGGHPSRASPSLMALDVGQGDAILVRDGSHAFLIDSGPSTVGLRRALARNHVRRLDAVVITHEHSDHEGGLQGLRGVVAVGRVLRGPPAEDRLEKSAPEREESRRLRASVICEGDVLTCGTWRLTALWPSAERREQGNTGSVVLLVTRGSFSALLCGDAETDVLEVLRREGRLGDVDAIKLGHHGSAGCVTEQDLQLLQPEIAVISVGSGNRFGHPSPSTLGVLGHCGVRVVRTDVLGDVCFGPSLAHAAVGRD